MNTVRKILVPIDFSEDSANGLKYAVSLAQKTDAELVVMHVTQKKEADAFLDLLAVMEGYPMLNAPAGMPVDRLMREKALDLYHQDSRQILGVHAIGQGATELIHIGQTVMAFNGTLDYFIENTFNYPTLAECYRVAGLNGYNKIAAAAG
jgi:nucleotide-binding universal stress UspA family protein